MSERIPTVCVHREGGRGHHIINEADFDPKRHKLFAPKAAKAEAPKGKAAK